MKPIYIFLIITATVFSFNSCDKNSGQNPLDYITKNLPHIPPEVVSAALKTTLDTISPGQYLQEESLKPGLINEIYEENEYTLLWATPGGFNRQGQELMGVLEKADHEGLIRENYNFNLIKNLGDSVFNATNKENLLQKLIHLDLMMTASYLTYASHMTHGRINPDKLNVTWRSVPREIDHKELLLKSHGNNEIEGSLIKLRPSLEQYEKLRKALADYRNIIMEGGWPMITKGDVLQEGDTSLRVEVLRHRLAVTADLARFKPGGKNNHVFDKEVVEAVKQFQKRHALTVTGKLDNITLEVLNIPADERAKQIKLNMERMRWLPESLGEKHVLVNIPEFQLKVYNKGVVKMEMKVIVGQTFRATPIFSDKIKYVVFRPDWNVPHSIATRTLLPKFKDNPGWLTANNYQLLTGWGANARQIDPHSIDWGNITASNFNFRLRQLPGANNSLGLVQFMFPNDLSIYLHDTPQNELFHREQRAFSSGCIRVERPAELAEYLLEDKGWNMQKIMTAMHGSQTRNVHLTEPVNVHLLYWTAWVGENGRMNFRNDLYNLDKQQMEALSKKEQSI